MLHLSNSATSDLVQEVEGVEVEVSMPQMDEMRRDAKNKALEIVKLLAEGEEIRWKPPSESGQNFTCAGFRPSQFGNYLFFKP